MLAMLEFRRALLRHFVGFQASKVVLRFEVATALEGVPATSDAQGKGTR